ncbi:MAG TPA: penicillin acylase family protein, partial [Chitinophagaceae bacterium]|nr:penicillin acylase family protein [Chitinophagaceae bacterium]
MVHRIQAVLAGLVTLALVILLGRWWSTSLPPLGRIFSPQEGFWQNAEPVNRDFSARLTLPELSDSATVWFDDRLVPHVFASDEKDLYFLEGYVTAEFRLWQMELQVRAAAGRISEILGPSALNFDRLQRRKGMVTAAQATWNVMEQDSLSRMVTDAYTAGVNAWIATLDYRRLPLEYKLLGYRPEPWTSFKCALLIKYMSDMLTGDVNSIENTNALRILSSHDFWEIYPDFFRNLDPIVPKGTRFDPPSRISKPPPGQAPLALAGHPGNYFEDRHDPDNGSNNWVVDGKKTRSGAPILCNDPHLDLNLPSIWYEIQLSCGNMNVYGVSLPGAPGVIIGFNDSIAFGETNAERDVKDYFAIRFRDATRSQYRWKNGWKQADLHLEKIRIRGHKPFTDTVAYTVFGPVTYDPSFPSAASPGECLASHWVGLDPSDEGKCIYLLNHATGYSGYLNALRYFQSPGQNFAFADKAGQIALWEQGKFPLLWKGQGKFVMPGQDSSWDWQGYIPYGENPHVVNPADGFVSSANQQPTDSTYPYYYSGD